MTQCSKYGHHFMDYDCPKCGNSAEWVEDYGCQYRQPASRIDNIGRNGNDGEHYSTVKCGGDIMSLEDAYNPDLDPWKQVWDSANKVTEDDHDMVTNPKHYDLIPEKNVQVIDVIRAALTEEEFKGYCRGNQIKYALRNKNDRAEDAGKCRQYIDFELEE